MLAKRLKELRETKGISQAELANLLGVAQQTVASWEREKSSPNYEILKRISEYFIVSTDYLLGRTDFKDPMAEIIVSKAKEHGVLPTDGEPIVMIPIYGRVVAGDPREPVQDIIGYTPITEHEAKQGEYFALKADGASMEPTFADGDILIIKQQETVDDGQIAIVLIGDEATVKRIYRDERGVSVVADNATVFKPRFFTNEKAEELPIRVLGRVIKVTRDV